MPRFPLWKKNLAVMWFAEVMGMAAITGVISFLPLYITHLGVEDLAEVEVWAGVLMAVTSLGSGLSGPYWGALGDRKGRKPIVERVMLFFSLVMIAMAFVTDVYQLLVLRTVQGIFGGFVASSMALVTSLAPAEEIGYTMGILQTAMVLGGACGPLFGGLLADWFGYRVPFLVFGGLCLISMATIHILVKENFQLAPQTGKQSIHRDIRSIITIPGISSMMLVLFLIQFAIQVVTPIMPLYIKTMVADSVYVATMAGAVVAAAGLTSAVSSASMGRLGRRFSQRHILMVAAALSAVFFVFQALAPDVLSLGVFRALSGFCLGAMIPGANTIIALLIPPERRGVAYGVSRSAALMGNVMGPLTGSMIAIYFGLPTVFWFTAVLFLATAVWVAWQVHIPREA